MVILSPNSESQLRGDPLNMPHSNLQDIQVQGIYLQTLLCPLCNSRGVAYVPPVSYSTALEKRCVAIFTVTLQYTYPMGTLVSCYCSSVSRSLQEQRATWNQS